MVTVDELFTPENAFGEPVTLDHGEQTIVRVCAALRTGMNRSAGTPDRKLSLRDGYDLDLDGMGGEMAYAKKRNVYVDLGVIPRRGGHDLVVNGLTVDVKTNANHNGDLLVKPSKANDPSDVYVLMTGSFPEYVYRGFALKEQVFKEYNLQDLGHGFTYVLPQSSLKR